MEILKVKCANCGKEIIRSKRQTEIHVRHFCCKDCESKWKHKQYYEIRNCEFCGVGFDVRKKVKKRFCSVECQNKWQKTNVKDKNPNFTGWKIKCEWCGVEYFEKKYKIEGKQHNFCCKDCRTSWYSNVYSQSEEWKDESKKRATELLSKNKYSNIITKPQSDINNLLNDMGIKYINEYNCVYYSIDNYLQDNNLMIEVMGDFWHCNPIKYNEIRRKIQINRIPKDKAKHTYILNNYGINILYLWESDIYNNIELCRKLILRYINNDGILNNYNSFNYSLINDELIENENIIIAYSEYEKIELDKKIVYKDN